MFEFARQHAWLIPAMPLIACVLIGIFGSKLKGLAHWPAILAMVGSFILAMSLVCGIDAHPDQIIKDQTIFTWFVAGGFHVPVAISVDQLTAIYLSFITGIGLLIFIYASGYMKGDYGYWRFFAYMSIFVFFMTTLVMGNNLIMLYLGWEGVGLASYLLIGYYYPRPSAVEAAKKAFITNRVGDFGLAIGIFIIYTYFGTVEYTKIWEALENKGFLTEHWGVLKFIPLCLMLGAFGKSAQFPLHVWLPDAMEGPTPVSALIHAATMVTAGIYLIARTMPLFLMDPDHYALHVVACVGGFTAFMAATIALCQYDLKRIWAYSTLSQLGYMFLGLGVMAAPSAVFHVFTHAFFKALLFLSAGSVMHAMGGELDIRKMSGVKKVMPITHFTMLIGCIALAGVPYIGAGFFSKDEIIEHAINSAEPNGFALGLLALVVALMTAYYTFRLYFKVFWGPLELPATAGHHEPSPFALADEHGHGHEGGHGHDAHGAGHGAGHGDDHGHGAHGPNDGSPALWMPLLVLCIGAVGAGYLGFAGAGDWFHKFLAPVLGGGEHLAAVGEHAAAAGEHAAKAVEHEAVPAGVLHALAFILPLTGIALAYFFHVANRPLTARLAVKFAPVVKFLYNKWYIDELYKALFLMPLRVLAVVLAFLDYWLLDKLVDLVGFIPQVAGYTLKPMQRGLLQRYAVGMVTGVTVIILCVLYLLR